ARIVELVGTQYAQGTLKVLLPSIRPPGAPFVNDAQLAAGIVGCRPGGHVAGSAIMRPLRLHSRTASRPAWGLCTRQVRARAQRAERIVVGSRSGHLARAAIMTSLRIQFRIASSPSSVLRLVKENGLSPRNSRESFSMTDRSAPT